MQTQTYTAQDMDIVKTLGLIARCLTPLQLADGWFEGDESLVAEAMQPLCDVGLVEIREVYAHSLLDMASPVASWKPGDADPTPEQIEALATYFKSRWNQSHQLFTVYVATRLGASLVGSHLLDPPDDESFTHDIHVAQLVINMMKINTPEEMSFLIGEGSLPKYGKLYIHRFKDPDIFVVDEHGQAKTVIEVGGESYDAEHLQKLHDHMSRDAYQQMSRHFANRKYRLYSDPDGTPYVLY